MGKDKLQRTIGLVPATSIGLGAMLGAGIFVFPGLAGGNAGFAAVFSFIIGGIIALVVAFCTAELATAMPQSRGGYFFISRSFGKYWGTLTGIAQWIGLMFACAFYLASFAEYALKILTELNIDWSGSAKIFSFSFTLLLLFINIIGTKKVGKVQNLMVISLTIILVMIFSYGLIDFLGLKNKSPAFTAIAPNGVKSVFTTTALIFTAYLGFVQIANIGSDIKKPSKYLPRSLIWSVLIAMGLYAFIMVICVIVLSQEELKNYGEIATIEVARKILGNWGAIIVVFAGLLAALSSANASMISASRGVFALSSDHLISGKASRINEKFGTPHISLIIVALPIGFLLIRDKLEVFAEVASFLHLIIYAGICLSVLKLRRTKPIWYIPTFRISIAKPVAVIGALSCLTLLIFMQKESIIISLGVLVFATVYYLIYVRRKPIKLNTPSTPHIDVDLFQSNILIPVDISREKKVLPPEILKALPVSKILLLGFKSTPEQSDSEQSENKFRKEVEEKLKKIQNLLEEEQIEFTTKLLFSHKIASEITQLIQKKELHFILALKEHAEFNQLVIPIYDSSQISNQLSTVIYGFNSNRPLKIKVLFLIENEDDQSKEAQLKSTLETQLNMVNIQVSEYESIPVEGEKPTISVLNKTKESDIAVWIESESFQREHFLNIILEKESKDISCSSLMVLKSL